MNGIIGNNGEVQFANSQSTRDLRATSRNLHERTDSTGRLKANGIRGATTPDAMHQAYGLVRAP
jgi:hypothetical protein